MSNMTRQRGRPVGTQINDNPTLTKMADLIAVNPALRPTTAIRRVLAAPGPSIIRRLQVKWKDHGAGLLVDAKARLDARKALEVSHQLAQAQLKAWRHLKVCAPDNDLADIMRTLAMPRV